jgi:hypothetical protein
MWAARETNALIMDRSLPMTNIKTADVLTVGRLLEKLQFEDVDNRVCICVENPPETPPSCVTLLIATADDPNEVRDLFVWIP